MGHSGTPWLLLAGAAEAFSEPSSTSPRQAFCKEKAEREHQHGATTSLAALDANWKHRS